MNSEKMKRLERLERRWLQDREEQMLFDIRHSPFKSKWNFTLKLVIMRRIVPGLGSSCHCDPVTMCMCVSAGEEASF